MIAPRRPEAFDGRIERLQEGLAALDRLGEPAARAAARDLLQAVIELHGLAVAELLAIVEEAGTQPADMLMPRFAANPKVGALLLLHDLHPHDMATRAGKAVDHLHARLAGQGVRIDLAAVDSSVVRIRVSPAGQHTKRPAAAELRREIEHAVLEAAPDAVSLVIEGLDATAQATEAYVPLPAPAAQRRTSKGVDRGRRALGGAGP